MARRQSNENKRVRRITIDDKLEEKLIRVLVCNLAPGVREFSDLPEDWGMERAFSMRPGNYAKMLGLPSGEQYQKQYTWDALSEGQVFLSGEFEADNPESPTKFRVVPGRKEFVRIDQVRFFRDRFKEQYAKLLKRKV